jgi:hypothetical protein
MKHPPPEERPKGYMEDQWIRRQADYVRYLWESYQHGHWNMDDAKYIWDDAYKSLKGEFDDFRDKHKEIEESRKVEEKKLKVSNAKDLLDRLCTGKQILDQQDEKELLYNLKARLYKRRFSNALKELTTKYDEIPATNEGIGSGAEMEDEETRQKKTITMIETVSEEAYEQIPDNLKLTEQDIKRILPGFKDQL